LHTARNYSALPTDAVAKVGKNPRDQVKLDHSEHAVKKRMVESEQLSEDQKQALCCLQENKQSAFIIMPTGSGQTSLIWLFKRESECSIMFAPFQLLVKQVCNVLKQRNNTWFWPFDGSRVSVDCMLATAQFSKTNNILNSKIACETNEQASRLIKTFTDYTL
jgi:hypothetical protein